MLTAIPLFLFMGYIVERANIVNRLFTSAQIASRRVPGSLAVAALDDLRAIRDCHRHRRCGRDADGPAGVPGHAQGALRCRLRDRAICAGGTLGIFIPPSIMLIVYAATSGVSIVRLYAGAMFPGFMLPASTWSTWSFARG